MGLSVPASAEDTSDGLPDTIENYFWICLTEKEVKFTSGGEPYCCDGAACYVCNKDLNYCVIVSDSAAGSSPKIDLKSRGLNIRQMQERPTEGQLRGVCTRARANFTKLEGFGYSCVKSNCNGEGDYCSIVCHGDRRCAAGTPDVIKGAVSLLGILQNGDNIDRNGSSTPDESLGGKGDGDGGNPCGPDGCLY